MKKQKLIVAALCLAQFAFAQSKNITIELTESNKSPVIGATVKLADRIDTSKHTLFFTDTQGQLKTVLLTGHQYLLEASYTGMAPLIKGINVTTGSGTFRFVMQEDATALQTVTITGKKPLMRQEEDKTIVDPEPIAAASTSAFEVMEKIPGLFLDQDGNVYLTSATPATIYINGREQKMSAEDIASMLKSLPPNSIDKIELLRSPSAKYDASGSGGIVNIVLKKGVKIGRTGSVNAGLNQGRFGNQYAGISLNNSDGPRSSTLNLSVSNRKSYDQLLTNRQLSSDTLLTQDAYTRSPGQSIFASYSYGYDPDDRWSLNMDGRANYGLNHSTTTTQNLVSIPDNGLTVSQNLNDTGNEGNNFSFNQGFSAKCKLDTSGSELSTDLSYNLQLNENDQVFSLFSIIPVSANTLGGLGDISNRRHYFSGQVDFKYKFPHKITLEAGVKTSIQRFRNEAAYRIVLNGAENPDPFRTNTFHFNEDVHSAYLQGSKTMGHFILKAGARLENTNMYGRQLVPSDTSFRIRRSDLFPYVFLSRKVMSIAGYELRGFLVYRKSISRPAYSYLNPFPKFLDQYLYEAGNPGLRPQFTENYEANISFNDMPIVAIGKNYTQDIFTNVIYQDPELPGVAYRTYDNLGKNEETYFRVVGALPPGGTYFFVAGAQYNYNNYNGLYENKPLAFSRGSWNFFTYHQLKIGGPSMFTLHGFIKVNGQLQFYELSNFGGLGISINRQFLNKKLIVTLNANDLFFTNRNEFTLDQGNIMASGERSSDTRRFGVNVRYNFGFKKREEKSDPFSPEGMDRSDHKP